MMANSDCVCPSFFPRPLLPANPCYPLPPCPTHKAVWTGEEEEGSGVEALEAGCRNTARWGGDSCSLADPIGFTPRVCVRAI